MGKKGRTFVGYVPLLLGMLAVVVLTVFPVGIGSAGDQSGAEVREDIALRVLFSGGLKGNIEPCG